MGIFRGGLNRRPSPLNSANISMKVWNLVSWLSGKIIKIVATRCQILRLKCAKCNFGWGSTPDPAGGAYSTPPDPLAGLRGLLLRVGEGMGRGRDGKRRGSLGEGRGRDPIPSCPPNPYFWIHPCVMLLMQCLAGWLSRSCIVSKRLMIQS